MPILVAHTCPRDYTIAERLEFYSMPEPNSGCQLWLGGCDGHGAAQVPIGRQLRRAARVVWEEKRGPIPEGAHVLHKCDNPGCINVAHLFLGDQAANMADKAAKGRQSRGRRHSIAKRTADALFRRIREGDPELLAFG